MTGPLGRGWVPVLATAAAVALTILGSLTAANWSGDEQAPVSVGAPTNSKNSREADEDTASLDCRGDFIVVATYDFFGPAHTAESPEQIAKQHLSEGETVRVVDADEEEATLQILRVDGSTRALLHVSRHDHSGWILSTSSNCPAEPLWPTTSGRG